MTEALPHLSPTHYARVVVVLRGMGIQARKVSGETWTGIEILRDEDRIYWGNTEGDPSVVLPWGWTMVDRTTGEIRTGRTHIAPDASPEDVALAVVTAYDSPEDGPAL